MISTGGRSIWPLAALVMALVTAAVIGFGVVAGILSPTVVLDVVALWPLGALAVLVAVFVWFRRGRSPRSLALPGLILVSWLVVALGLHLSGWSVLPSSAADVSGPDGAAIETARLTIEFESGELQIGANTGPELYRAGVLRIGGESGVPEAFERVLEGDAAVVISERADSDWFRFGGWWVQLGQASWQLELSARVMEADLADLALSGAVVNAGSGSLVLGVPAADSTISITGPLRVSVPSGVSVLVVGPADAPSSWARTSDGWASDASGPGWRIEVEGAAIEIVAR